jgi:uncharacterized protein
MNLPHSLTAFASCLLRILIAVFAWVVPGWAQDAAKQRWDGEITLPTMKLAVSVTVENVAEVWKGTIDIPAQGIRGLKLGGLVVDGVDVRFELPGIPGDPRFVGKLESGARVLRGDFTQSGQKFPFQLKWVEAGVASEAEEKGMPGSGLAGFWRGVLQPSPFIQLRLGLEVKAGDNGLEGVMISLDQDNSRIPLSKATVDGEQVHLGVARIGGVFAGKLKADGSEISGEWEQNGQKFPLVFKRLDKAAKLNRPQEPKKPYPYGEEEVVFENGVAKIQLAGTLTVPSGTGPHPAVILLTGSGPQDRNETVMGHRPFLILADHLSRHGIAVLRYDDRGFGKSTGDFATATHADFVEDALAAVMWLKTRKEIDPKRIGFIGHSEGGLVAPLATVRRPEDVAFLVLLAAPAVPLDEVLIRQSEDIIRGLGVEAKMIERSSALQREAYALIKSETDKAVLEPKLRALFQKQIAGMKPEHLAKLGITEGKFDSQLQMIQTAWFRGLINYDPRPTLRDVKCPVLALNGEKDIQVAAKVNLAAIREAVAAGKNGNVKVLELPGLNHLFQTCVTGAFTEYAQIEETFSPVALKEISDWVRGRVGL